MSLIKRQFGRFFVVWFLICAIKVNCALSSLSTPLSSSFRSSIKSRLLNNSDESPLASESIFRQSIAHQPLDKLFIPASPLPEVNRLVITGNEAEFVCPTKFGHYRDASDCSQYFICSFGISLLKKCQPGLYFHERLQTCDWPENVPCEKDFVNLYQNKGQSAQYEKNSLAEKFSQGTSEPLLVTQSGIVYNITTTTPKPKLINQSLNQMIGASLEQIVGESQKTPTAKYVVDGFDIVNSSSSSEFQEVKMNLTHPRTINKNKNYFARRADTDNSGFWERFAYSNANQFVPDEDFVGGNSSEETNDKSPFSYVRHAPQAYLNLDRSNPYQAHRSRKGENYFSYETIPEIGNSSYQSRYQYKYDKSKNINDTRTSSDLKTSFTATANSTTVPNRIFNDYQIPIRETTTKTTNNNRSKVSHKVTETLQNIQGFQSSPQFPSPILIDAVAPEQQNSRQEIIVQPSSRPYSFQRLSFDDHRQFKSKEPATVHIQSKLLTIERSESKLPRRMPLDSQKINKIDQTPKTEILILNQKSNDKQTSFDQLATPVRPVKRLNYEINERLLAPFIVKHQSSMVDNSISARGVSIEDGSDSIVADLSSPQEQSNYSLEDSKNILQLPRFKKRIVRRKQKSSPISESSSSDKKSNAALHGLALSGSTTTTAIQSPLSSSRHRQTSNMANQLLTGSPLSIIVSSQMRRNSRPPLSNSDWRPFISLQSENVSLSSSSTSTTTSSPILESQTLYASSTSERPSLFYYEQEVTKIENNITSHITASTTTQRPFVPGGTFKFIPPTLRPRRINLAANNHYVALAANQTHLGVPTNNNSISNNEKSKNLSALDKFVYEIARVATLDIARPRPLPSLSLTSLKLQSSSPSSSISLKTDKQNAQVTFETLSPITDGVLQSSTPTSFTLPSQSMTSSTPPIRDSLEDFIKKSFAITLGSSTTTDHPTLPSTPSFNNARSIDSSSKRLNEMFLINKPMYKRVKTKKYRPLVTLEAPTVTQPSVIAHSKFKLEETHSKNSLFIYQSSKDRQFNNISKTSFYRIAPITKTVQFSTTPSITITTTTPVPTTTTTTSFPYSIDTLPITTSFNITTPRPSSTFPVVLSSSKAKFYTRTYKARLPKTTPRPQSAYSSSSSKPEVFIPESNYGYYEDYDNYDYNDYDLMGNKTLVLLRPKTTTASVPLNNHAMDGTTTSTAITTTTTTTTTTTSTTTTTPAPRRRLTSKPSYLNKARPTKKRLIIKDSYNGPVTLASRPLPLYQQPEALQPAQKCDRKKCRMPDCRCGGSDIPGGLSAKDIPQLVMLTFDDGVNDLNWELYEELLNSGKKNPNGCGPKATFYVSHEWTNYGQVQTLYSRGHEIASHTISHRFGEKFSKEEWTKEINGQREILNMYGGVAFKDIRGMRAPFLQTGGNSMFEMLYESNFTYDSSLPVQENTPAYWPYTLDYQLAHSCNIPPCPTKSFPGLWEVGMVMWSDLRGGRCSMGDACSNPPDQEGVYEMLMKNFNRHYKSTRAPFSLYYHSAWFNTQHHRKGFLKFWNEILSKNDVYLVTTWQMLQWIRKPTPLSELFDFEPFGCDIPPPIPECLRPKACNLNSKQGSRTMMTCQGCPQTYPWIGMTGFPKSRYG